MHPNRLERTIPIEQLVAGWGFFLAGSGDRPFVDTVTVLGILGWTRIDGMMTILGGHQ
jgi:hypothetical protein